MLRTSYHPATVCRSHHGCSCGRWIMPHAALPGHPLHGPDGSAAWINASAIMSLEGVADAP